MSRRLGRAPCRLLRLVQAWPAPDRVARQAGQLAVMALRLAADTAEVRLAALKREVEKMLG